jgi:ribosome-associated heat shock protein Hsp15
MTIRLDKWLWAARFFKTRSLACNAVKGGKVSINGLQTKPGSDVVIGDVLTIRQGHDLKIVYFRDLYIQRGPASVAQNLYEETIESKNRREKEKQLRQLSAAQRPRGEGRPTKRARRQIHRFTDPD